MAKSTELVPLKPEEYPALDPGNPTRALIEANTGGEPLSPFDLKIPFAQGKTTVWSLSEEQTVKRLVGPIIYTCRHNLRWTGKIGDGTPPVCKSADGRTGVGDPGGDCLKCPHGKPGSGDRGPNSRSCNHRRFIAMVIRGQDLPVFLSVPATSLGPMRRYLGVTLQRQRLMYHQCVTSLGLETKDQPEPHAVVVPEFAGRIDEAGCETALQYQKELEPAFEMFLEQAEQMIDGGATEEV